MDSMLSNVNSTRQFVLLFMTTVLILDHNMMALPGNFLGSNLCGKSKKALRIFVDLNFMIIA